jgi:hypothetical protein
MVQFKVNTEAFSSEFKRLVEFLVGNNYEFSSQPVLPQTHVSGSLPLAELGSFVDWIREMNFKQYADGWCEAGGSNGWHCTTDELMRLYRDKRQ